MKNKPPGFRRFSFCLKGFLIILLLAVPVSHRWAFGGEYTAGLRYTQDFYTFFGRVGAHPALYGLPFVPSQNWGAGVEAFGEFSLTREFFIEPFFGMLWQDRVTKYPGLETNVNGVSTFANNIYDYWENNSLSFGFTVKGKSPGLSKMFRVFASYGIQFIYSYETNRLQNETVLVTAPDGSLTEREGAEPESVRLCQDARIASEINKRTAAAQQEYFNKECAVSPWGFRLLGGIGIEIYHPALKGVVFQADLRLGFDLTQALFGSTLMNEKGLETSYFEIATTIHFGALYRLPLGRVKEMQTPKKKDRRDNLNED